MNDYGTAIVIGLMIVAVAFVWMRGRRLKPAGDGEVMPLGHRRVLIGYLLLLGAFLVYFLVQLLRVDYPDSGVVITADTTRLRIPLDTTTAEGRAARAAALAEADRPRIHTIFPQSILGTSPKFELAIYGQNFAAGTRVRINGETRAPKYVDENLIVLVAEPADIARVGTLVVEASSGTRLSNALTVRVIRPVAELRILWWTAMISREVQLMLLVLLAGALGSWVHAIKSLGDFIGNQTLTTSWFWWYITRPFLGMAMAFIFYAVLRAGFLTGSAADANVVNPFGAMAVAALVGMFADKASQKLAELFDVVFKSNDPRGGKLAGPVIEKLDPASVKSGSPAFELRIVGDRFTNIKSVKVGKEERRALRSSEKEVAVGIVAEDVLVPGKVPIAVVIADGTSSPSVNLIVTDLEIGPAQLPGGKAGTPYSAKLVASGGKPPYRWSGTDKPVWLKLDERSGDISGTPDVTSTVKFKVSVTDAEETSVSREMSIVVA